MNAEETCRKLLQNHGDIQKARLAISMSSVDNKSKEEMYKHLDKLEFGKEIQLVENGELDDFEM